MRIHYFLSAGTVILGIVCGVESDLKDGQKGFLYEKNIYFKSLDMHDVSKFSKLQLKLFITTPRVYT